MISSARVTSVKSQWGVVISQLRLDPWILINFSSRWWVGNENIINIQIHFLKAARNWPYKVSIKTNDYKGSAPSYSLRTATTLQQHCNNFASTVTLGHCGIFHCSYIIYCETQPLASIGWVALSTVIGCRLSRIGDISSHLHYMMFLSIQTIYFLWGYDPGNMSVSTFLLLLSWAQFTVVYSFLVFTVDSI